MAKRKVLERLLRLRELEEEQQRLALEAAVGERNRKEGERTEAITCRARGRSSWVAGIELGDSAARTGAAIEMELAGRWRSRLEPHLATAEAEVERERAEFLARRTERRQVETLVDREYAAMLEEASLRAQQMLDDWYGRKSTLLQRTPRKQRPSAAVPEEERDRAQERPIDRQEHGKAAATSP